jgi:hypothetical protein
MDTAFRPPTKGETEMTFARIFDNTVAIAFVAISVMLAGATAIVGA